MHAAPRSHAVCVLGKTRMHAAPRSQAICALGEARARPSAGQIDDDEVFAPISLGKVTPTPPLRLNRINIKTLYNDTARSVVFNTRQDSLGWLRTKDQDKVQVPAGSPARHPVQECAGG